MKTGVARIKKMAPWNRRWLPGLMSLGVVALTLGIWRSLQVQQAAETQRNLTEMAASTARILEADLNAVSLGLNRSAQRWQIRGGTPQAEWQVDAGQYIKDTAGLQSIEWIDRTLQPRWISATSPSMPDPDRLSLLKAQRTALQASRLSQGSLPSGLITLRTYGQSHFHGLVPLFLRPSASASQFDGFFFSTFDAPTFFGTVIAHVPPTYNIAVLENGETLYQRHSDPNRSAGMGTQTATLKGHKSWQVRVWLYSTDSLSPHSFLLTNVVLGAGLSMAALLALVTYFAQAMRDRTRQLEAINHQITMESAIQQRLALALQESEVQYRDLFENSNDLIVSVDMAGRFLYVNRAWKQTLGYDESDLATLTLFDLAFPDCGGRCDNLRQCLTVGEAIANLEVAFNAKNQQRIWLEGSLNFRLVDQQPVSMRCIFRNINDRRQADRDREHITEQLRRSEERWQLAIQANNDGIWDLDLTTNTAYRSTRWGQMLGYTPGELLDSNVEWQTRIHPDDRARVLQTEQDYLDRRIPQLDQIYRLRHKNGSYRWVQSRAQAVWDKAGTPIRLVGSTTDITEQTQAQAAKKQDEEEILHLSQALEVAVVGISQVDCQGYYTKVKSAYAHLLGYLPEDLVGQHWHDLIYVDDRNLAIAAYQEMLSHDKAEVEVRAVHKNQSVLEQKIVLVKAYDEMQQFIGHYGFMKDISDRREVERLKEQFVSIVSHELRTPLTSISVALDLLAGGVLQSQPEQAQRMLNIASNNTDRLVRLINDILDIERVRSGKVAMNKETCTLAALFTQSVEAVQDMADKANVALVVSALSARLWVDSDRIVQVLVNLLSNAIKFSSSGDTVWLKAEVRTGEVGNEPAEGDQDPPTPYLLLSVQDHGRGIPLEKLEAIFEPFQQVDASDSRQKGGTGLGLAICRSIVQQHNGKIWVESHLAEGSTFWVQLPALWEVEEATLHQPQLDNASLVLMCDDDSSVRSVIQTVLHQQGYRVLAVASGREAVEQARMARPQVVLLNLIMPEMDGWETLARLKGQPETQAIPVVILSGLLPDATQVDRPEINGWVVKPPNRKVLLQTLQRALNKPYQNIRILIIEDDLDLARLLIAIFTRHHLKTFHAQTGQDAIRLSQEIMPDLLVLDLSISQGDGFAIVDWLRQHNHLNRLPIVVYTARELEPEERDRLTLDHTLFLTKGRITPQQFEQRVIALLNRMTQPSTQKGQS
ncbi:PAS domain S-box protein [Phormidesmis sp. 146-33]